MTNREWLQKRKEELLHVSSSAKAWAGNGFKIAEEVVVEERMSICSTCPILKGRRCGHCNCYIPAKIRLIHESCPMGKWKAGS